MNKYRAKKVSLKGYTFDSKAEARRFGELMLLERAKKIISLEVHPTYHLNVNGQNIGKYIGDFRYIDPRTNYTIVEDVKSPVTAKLPAFKMKKKLMLALYGIEVKEVRA